MISITSDSSSILNFLDGLAKDIQDPSDFLDATGQYFASRIAKEFRTESGPDNKKWTPLSPATIAEKTKKGFPNKILARTGAMQNSVQYFVRGKTVGIYVGFPAQFHQTGTIKMPQRQILPDNNLSKTDERNIIDIAVQYLDI